MKTDSIEGKVVAIRKGIYTNIVFESNNQLVFFTILPNWNINLKLGDKGTAQIDYIEAGDIYYDAQKQTNVQYKYTANYLRDFKFLKSNPTIIL